MFTHTNVPAKGNARPEGKGTQNKAFAKEKSGLNQLNQLARQTLRNENPSVPEYAIPSPRFRDNTSNELTRSIIKWLQLNGHQAERIAVTGRRIDNRKTVTDAIGRSKIIGSIEWIRSSMQPGTADISAIIKGKPVKIEVKIGRDTQSDDQKTYQEQVETAGGCYLIVKDFQMFFDWYGKEVSDAG